jgi:integrase
MFLLSFVLVGINSMDLFTCENYDHTTNVLAYNRSKVEGIRDDNGLIKIRIEPEILPLFQKYKNLNRTKNEVFNFCNKYKNSECFNIKINGGLKLLKHKIGLGEVNNFTQYSARRSWATISRNDAKINKYDVHEALNHVDADMKVTDLYVDRDFSHIWDANRKVLDLFDWTNISQNLATHEVICKKK